MGTVLHRTGIHQPVANLTPGTWFWDDRNDEPALFRGPYYDYGSLCDGSYTATWADGLEFILEGVGFDRRPRRVEVLRTTEHA